MPARDDFIILLIATIIAVALTAAGFVAYFIFRRFRPFVTRVWNVFDGVIAAVQLNWRTSSKFVTHYASNAEAWAAEQRRKRDEQFGHAFPVQTVGSDTDAGLTWYRVIGIQRATQQDVDVLIDARTAANASAKAELRGIVVTKVEPLQVAAAI
jgi:hypothetical protein